MEDLFVYILAGGQGTRLWPLSKPQLPKQFLSIHGDTTLLQQAVTRHKFIPTKPNIITLAAYKKLALSQLATGEYLADLILEPSAQGTLTSAIIAALDALSHHRDPCILLVPADHAINPPTQYQCTIEHGYRYVGTQHFVLFGVKPESAYPGYGYIVTDRNMEFAQRVYLTQAFYEKPHNSLINSLLSKEGALWNTGIFMLKAIEFLRFVQDLLPETYAQVQMAYCNSTRSAGIRHLDSYSVSDSPSLDKAILEKDCGKIVVEAEWDWHDLGSWYGIKRWLESQAVQTIEMAGADNTVSNTSGAYYDTNDCLFWSNKFVAAVGVHNLAVIESEDCLLIANLSQTEQMEKAIVTLSANIPEPLGQDTTFPQQEHTHKVIREAKPWGYAVYLATDGRNYVVKQLHIMPGQRLSLQSHRYRAEHWLVITGRAEVLLDTRTQIYIAPQYIHIPVGKVHRLANVGLSELIVIEVQCGEWISERDIIRIADDYGRVEI